MGARIVSNQVINSLQISVLKNISDDDVEVTIIPAG